MTTYTLDTSGATMVLKTRAGVDLHFVIEMQNPDGSPMDITGYEVLAHAYVEPDNEPPIVIDATLSGPSSITVRITSALTATLPSSCRYSISMASPDGVVTGLFHGPLQVDQAYPA